MTTQSEKAAGFLELHRPGNPLLLPNPWDQGSARLLASLGFQALATTSSGYAATLGRLDGSVSRDEALAHAAAVVAATDLPVSADLENCFADDSAGVARTVALAAITVQPEEVAEYRLTPPDDALALLRPRIRRRVRAATRHRRCVYLENGRPVPGIT